MVIIPKSHSVPTLVHNIFMNKSVSYRFQWKKSHMHVLPAGRPSAKSATNLKHTREVEASAQSWELSASE